MTSSKPRTQRSEQLEALLDQHEPKGFLQERVDVTEFFDLAGGGSIARG